LVLRYCSSVVSIVYAPFAWCRFSVKIGRNWSHSVSLTKKKNPVQTRDFLAYAGLVVIWRGCVGVYPAFHLLVTITATYITFKWLVPIGVPVSLGMRFSIARFVRRTENGK
jgi:hypothetical protein